MRHAHITCHFLQQLQAISILSMQKSFTTFVSLFFSQKIILCTCSVQLSIKALIRNMQSALFHS
jgi:hypothetical protein